MLYLSIFMLYLCILIYIDLCAPLFILLNKKPDDQSDHFNGNFPLHSKTA